jgi:DNA-binding beta-propeller fold protein YncE
MKKLMMILKIAVGESPVACVKEKMSDAEKPKRRRIRTRISGAVFGLLIFTGVVPLTQTCFAQEKKYTVVAVEVQGAKLGFYDPNTGAKLGSVAIGLKPHEVEISADGKTAYVANFGIEDYDHHIGTPGTTISVIDIPKMREKFKLSTENVKTHGGAVVTGKGPHGIKLRPVKEAELFVNTEFGGDLMLVYDTKKRRLKRSFAIPTGAHNFIFSRDGKSLYLFAGANGVFKINPETGETLAQMKLATPARGLHYTHDNRFIIAAGSGEVALLNPENLAVERRFENLGFGQILYPKPTPDGKYILLPAVLDSLLAVLDINSGKIVHRLKVGKNPIAVAISPDGGTAYVSSHTDTSFDSIDLKTFEFKKFADVEGSNGIGIGRQIKN